MVLGRIYTSKTLKGLTVLLYPYDIFISII